MGIFDNLRLPAWLQQLLAVLTGMFWPNVDHEVVHEQAAKMDAWGDHFESLLHTVGPSATLVSGALEGPTAEEFIAHVRKMKQVLPHGVKAARELSSSFRETAVQVQYAKYMIMVQLVWLIYTVVELLAFGLPEVAVAVARGVAAVVRQIAWQLFKSVVSGAVVGGLMELGVQLVQMWQGFRDRISWRDVLEQAGWGGVGGGLAGIFDEFTRMYLPKLSGGVLRDVLTGGVSGAVVTGFQIVQSGDTTDVGYGIAGGFFGSLPSGGRHGRGGGSLGDLTGGLGWHVDPSLVPSGEWDSFHGLELPDGARDGAGTRSVWEGSGTGGSGGDWRNAAEQADVPQRLTSAFEGWVKSQGGLPDPVVDRVASRAVAAYAGDGGRAQGAGGAVGEGAPSAARLRSWAVEELASHQAQQRLDAAFTAWRQSPAAAGLDDGAAVRVHRYVAQSVEERLRTGEYVRSAHGRDLGATADRVLELAGLGGEHERTGFDAMLTAAAERDRRIQSALRAFDQAVPAPVAPGGGTDGDGADGVPTRQLSPFGHAVLRGAFGERLVAAHRAVFGEPSPFGDDGQASGDALRTWQAEVRGQVARLPVHVVAQSAKELTVNHALGEVERAVARGTWQQAVPGLGAEFSRAFGLTDTAATEAAAVPPDVRQGAVLGLSLEAGRRIDQWTAQALEASPGSTADALLRHLTRIAVGGGSPERMSAADVVRQALPAQGAERHLALSVARAHAQDAARDRARALAGAAGLPAPAAERIIDHHAKAARELFDATFVRPGDGPGGPGPLDDRLAAWNERRTAMDQELGRALATHAGTRPATETADTAPVTVTGPLGNPSADPRTAASRPVTETGPRPATPADRNAAAHTTAGPGRHTNPGISTETGPAALPGFDTTVTPATGTQGPGTTAAVGAMADGPLGQPPAAPPRPATGGGPADAVLPTGPARTDLTDADWGEAVRRARETTAPHTGTASLWRTVGDLLARYAPRPSVIREPGDAYAARHEEAALVLAHRALELGITAPEPGRLPDGHPLRRHAETLGRRLTAEFGIEFDSARRTGLPGGSPDVALRSAPRQSTDGSAGPLPGLEPREAPEAAEAQEAWAARTPEADSGRTPEATASGSLTGARRAPDAARLRTADEGPDGGPLPEADARERREGKAPAGPWGDALKAARAPEDAVRDRQREETGPADPVHDLRVQEHQRAWTRLTSTPRAESPWQGGYWRQETAEAKRRLLAGDQRDHAFLLDRAREIVSDVTVFETLDPRSHPQPADHHHEMLDTMVHLVADELREHGDTAAGSLANLLRDQFREAPGTEEVFGTRPVPEPGGDGGPGGDPTGQGPEGDRTVTGTAPGGTAVPENRPAVPRPGEALAAIGTPAWPAQVMRARTATRALGEQQEGVFWRGARNLLARYHSRPPFADAGPEYADAHEDAVYVLAHRMRQSAGAEATHLPDPGPDHPLTRDARELGRQLSLLAGVRQADPARGAVPAAHGEMDAADSPARPRRLNEILADRTAAYGDLQQAELKQTQVGKETDKIAQAKDDLTRADAKLNEVTRELDRALEHERGNSLLSQRELNLLVDQFAGAGDIDRARILQNHALELDNRARATTDGSARPDQFIRTGEEIRDQSHAVQRLAKELEDSVAAGPVSPTGIKGLAERLDKAATELDVALQGHVKDAAELGGTYTLRNQHAPVVAVARHLARLVDAALQETAEGAGLVLERFRGTETSIHDVRGLSGLIRRYRTDKAFAEVPTGEQWRTVLPGEDERMRRLFPDLATMSKSDQVTFVRTLSERNIESLREEVGALLREMPEAERARFEELRKALEDLPYRIKHATPAYHAIANSGLMSSQGDLSRRGLRFLTSGKSSAKNTTNLGNDDFVFFRMEVGDRPMATRYGPTTLVFDAKVLEEQGGWVSLHDQLHPLDRDTMSQLKMGGDVVRSATYDDGFTEMGRRSRWTYTYPDKTTRQVSFEQEVFHGEHVREALALSVVREVHLIGGAFKDDVFRLLADAARPEELGAVVSRLYRPEAKFGSGLPINPYGSRVETEWPRPITVHDVDGDGRYLADGTVDPTARAAGKAFDEASDRVRQADSAVKSGNNKALRYNLNKALPHAEQSVKLTAEFQATAVGERKELANALLAQRARLLKDVEARLRELRSRPKPDPAHPQQKPDGKQGTGTPTAEAGPNLNELPRQAEDALNTVKGVTEQTRKVIRALGNSDGFRPLLDAKVSAQTHAAVGLGRTQFSTAYRHLSRAGLVIGGPAGLHLTEEGRRLFLPPRAGTGATASSPPPPTGVPTAQVGQGRASRHAGGADEGPREGPGAPDEQAPAPETAPGPADPARPLPDPGTAPRSYEPGVSGQRLHAVPVGERPGDTAFRSAPDTETAPPSLSGRVLGGDGLVLGGDEWVVRLGEARTAVGLLSPSDRRSLWRETAAVMQEHYPAPEVIRDSGDDYAGWFDAVAHVVALALLDDTARPVGADHPAQRLARNLLPQLSRLLKTPLVPSARPLLLGGSRVPAGQQARRELDRTLSGRPSAPSGSGPADSPGQPTGGEGSRGNRLRRVNNRLDLRSGAAPGSGDRDATASSAPRHGLSAEPRAVGAGEERGRSREPGRSSAAVPGTSSRKGGTGAGPSRAASVSAREGERGRQPTRGTAPAGRGGAGAPRAASSAAGGRRSSSVGRAFGSVLNFFVRDRDRRSASGVRAAAPTTPAESPGYWHARGQGRSGSVFPEPFGGIPPATRTSGQAGAAFVREASAPVNARTMGAASAERQTAAVPSRAGGTVEARAGNADPTRHEAEARAREAEAARRAAQARADEAEARAREAEAARRAAQARADEAQARAREAETSHQRGEAERTQREAQARAHEEAEARTRQAEAALRSDEAARTQREVDARARREAEAARALHEAEERLRAIEAARRRGGGVHARQEAAAWHEAERYGDEAAKATSALRRAENRAQQALEQARRTEVRHREAEAALRQVQTERARRDARQRDDERAAAARARREAQQRLQEARASADDAEAARREAVAVRREAEERAREAEAARRAVEAARAQEKATAQPRKDETRDGEAHHPVPALPSQRNPQPHVWRPTAVMTPDGKTGGIDVRPAAKRLANPVKQLQTKQQILYGQSQSRAYETPPWVSSEDPFFVFVDGSASELVVASETGERKMSAEEFARFLKALPAELSPAEGAPIVLVLSHGGAGGLELPRGIAYHMDRTVWSFTSVLQLVTNPHTNLTYLYRNYPADGSRPAGWWVSSRPEDIGPNSVTAAATSSRALDAVEHHTLVNAQGRPIGRIAHTPDDLAKREMKLAYIATADTYHQGAQEGRQLTAIDGTARKLPWRVDYENVTPYFFAAHGKDRKVKLPLSGGGKRIATGSELAGFLKRRPSFNQRKDVPIVLMSCRTGSDPSPEGVAQSVANETRRVVYAPTNVSSVSFLVGRDPDGTEGRWVRFDPAAGGTGASRTSRPRPARPVDEPVLSARLRLPGGAAPLIDSADADPTGHEPSRQSPVGGPDRRGGIDEFAERPGGTSAHGVLGGRSGTGAPRPDPVPSRRRNRGVQDDDPFADDRELRRGVEVLRQRLRDIARAPGSDDAGRSEQVRRITEAVRALRQSVDRSDLTEFLRGPRPQLAEGLRARQLRIARLEEQMAGRRPGGDTREARDEADALRREAERIREEIERRPDLGPLPGRTVLSAADMRIARILVAGEAGHLEAVALRREADDLHVAWTRATRSGTPDTRQLAALGHRAQEDRALYSALAQRRVWQRVDDVQATHLVAAERHAWRLRDADRLAARDRLLRAMRDVRDLYPVKDDGVAGLLDLVHEHLDTGMALVSKVSLRDAGAGAALLDALLSRGAETPLHELLASGTGTPRQESGGVAGTAAALVSARWQPHGADDGIGLVFHWAWTVRERTLHTLSPYPDDPGRRATPSSRYALIAHGPVDAVRLALAETDRFASDRELLRRLSAHKPVGNAHFGARVLGDLRWPDVRKVVLTHADAPSWQRAEEFAGRLEEFAERHGLRFEVGTAPVQERPFDSTGPASGGPRTLVTDLSSADGTRIVGRDYRPERERSVVTPAGLDTAAVAAAVRPADRDASPLYELDERQAAPWTGSGSEPFFVLAWGTPERIAVQDAGGRTVELSPERFAGLLAEDPVLGSAPRDRAIVLAMPHGGAGGLDLPRLLAGRTGREVWSATGPLEIVPDAVGSRLTGVITRFPSDASVPRGWWVLSRPADAVPARSTTAGPDVLSRTDGEATATTELVTHTLVGFDHRPIGRLSLPADFLARVEGTVDRASWRDTEGAGGQPFPWAGDVGAGRHPYFWMSHGWPTDVEMVSHDGNHRFPGAALGRYLRRRPSLAGLDAGHPIVLLSCSTGDTRGAGEPGAVVAQKVADATGRAVHAADTPVFVSGALPPGGAWHTFLPHRTESAWQAQEAVPSPGRTDGTDGPLLGGRDWSTRLTAARRSIEALDLDEQGQLWADVAAIMQKPYRTTPYGPQPYPAPKLIRDGSDTYAEHYHDIAHLVAAELLADTAQPSGRDTSSAEDLAGELLSQLHHRREVSPPVTAGPAVLGGSGRAPGARPEDERGRTRHRTARPGGGAGRAESRAGGTGGEPGNSFARTFRAASRAVARSLSRAFGRDQEGSRRPQSRVRPPREINPYADAGPSGSRAGGERRPLVSAGPSADGRSATHGHETPGIPGLSFPGRSDNLSDPRRDGTGTRRGVSVERPRGQGSGQAFDMTSVRDRLPEVQPEYWTPAAILDTDIRMVGIDLRPRSERDREPLTGLDTHDEFIHTDALGGNLVRAQWRTYAGEPFFVAVHGSSAQLTVATSRGEKTVTAEEFADRLGRLPVVRNSNGPIVLVLSHGGVGDLLLPRLIARETGRSVWSFVSTLRLSGVDGRTYITRAGLQTPSKPRGWWVRSERGDLDTATLRRYGKDIRGERFYFDEVEHYALVDQTGRSVGRIAHPEAEIPPREHGLLGMAAAESLWHARRREDGELVTYAQRPQVVPWKESSSGKAPYFFVSHGNSQSVVLPVKGRTNTFVDGATLARFLRRRTSFTRSKDAPVVLMACETGSDTSQRGVGQQVANGTGRLVYAPTTLVSVNMVLAPESDGTPGRWNVFRPQADHDARTAPPAGGPVLPVAGPGPGGSGLRPSVSRPGPGGAGGHVDRAPSRTRQPSRSGRSTGAGTAVAAPGGGAVRDRPAPGSRGPARGFVPQGARMPDASPHADTATADGPPLDGDGPDSSRHVVTDTLPDGERTSGREHDTLPAKAPSDVTDPSAPPGVPRRDGGYADTAPQAVGVRRAVDATPHGDPHAAGAGAVADPPSAGDAVRSRPAPAMPEPSRAPGGGSASRPAQPAAFPPRTDAELDAHRPPRLDRSMLPPAESGRTVRFTDGSRLPAYLTGDGAEGRPASYGPGLVTLRGIDQVMREIGARTGLADSPAPGAAGVMADLERALRETPWVFQGEGYESSPFQDRGQPRVLRVVTRPHGNWERFADGYGAPFKYEGVQRAQTTTGTAKSVATSLRIAPGFTIGPPSGLSLAGYGRVGGALGFSRTFDFALQDQTQTQAETRHGDGSHVHLDDVQYEVHLAGPRPAERRPRPADAYSSGEGHFSFGVRNGLAVRLSDGETPSADPGSVADADRVPRSMTLGPHTDYRLVHTEGYGPVREIRDWALRRAGAQPGSSAYDEIAGFFSSANFHRIADRLAHGPVPTRQLASDDRGRTPLGAFVVERVVPGGAELVTGTTAAELRGTVQRTVRNERTLSKAYTQELNATVGPTMSFGRFFAGHAGLRVMAGLSARYARTTTHGTVSGGTGSRKSAGQAKKVPTYLYRVHKTVFVRRAGDAEATAFTTWSLDRMTRTEARRHAGWDDGTTLRRRHDNEPAAPVYLPTDDPVTLGPSRLEAFLHEDGSPLRDQGAGEPARTLLDDLLDQVLHHAARAYPGMLAPLTDFGDPSHARWKDAEHYRMALQNTLSVVDTLSHHSLAAGLESLITTGVRVGLVVPGTFGRARRWLWIDGRLTDRRYEGTQNDLLVRSSLPGTERLDGQRNVVRGYDVGVDVSATVLDAHKNRVGAPENTGALQFGPRWAAQTGRRTGFGATVSTESGSAGTSQSHLFSYRLELAVSTGGFWRPRHLWRIASLGLLGTQAFIRRADTLALVGGGTRASVTGRVLLAVPGEHTPAPGLAPDAVRRTAPRVRVLAPARAREIALGTGDAGRARSPFGDLPHTTVSVAAHRELISAAEELMREASGGSWHFAEPGALAHEALVRPFEAPYLSGQSDLSSAPAGTRITGLFGKGPYMDRLGALLHRVQVLNPRVVSVPLRMETEHVLGSDLQASGAVTTSHAFSITVGGSYGHAHPVGPTVAGTYGALGRWSRQHTRTLAASRVVTNEIAIGDDSHKVLVVADTRHELIGTVRGDGALSVPHSLLTARLARWSGRRLTFSSDWLGHVPEKAAHRMGLLDDRMGEVPRYLTRTWEQPSWLREHPFGSYPVNGLDATGVLHDLDRRLRGLGLDSAGRDRLRATVAPRALRALREQLTSTGSSTGLRVGALGRRPVWLGSRIAHLRVELMADAPRFDGLGHGVTFKDGRQATETDEAAVAEGRSRTLGVNIAEGVRTSDRVARSAGPAYGESGTSTQQVTQSRARTRLSARAVETDEPHAEYLTDYRLRMTLELGGGRTVQAEGPVGTLRELVPLSLTVPGEPRTGDDPPAAWEAGAPRRAVTVWGSNGGSPWEQREALRAQIENWRAAPGPGGTATPFRVPRTGFDVRRIVGLDAVRAAGEIALARAYGATAGPRAGRAELSGPGLDEALERARRTSLTRPGTAPALALHDGTSNAALAAFFDDSTTAGGLRVHGLTDDTFFTRGSRAELSYRSRPHLSGARLLAVLPSGTMSGTERLTSAGDVSVVRSGAHEPVPGGGPSLDTGGAGTAAPSASVSESTTADADAVRYGGAAATQTTLKPKTTRAFLFAIPTSWVAVADVERGFKDSPVGDWMHEHLGPFGPSRPGPQAVSAETQVIAWVREDVARELGLVTDDTFPAQVAEAWSKVTKAGTAWVDADKAYWKLRRTMPDSHAAHARAHRDRTAAKSELTDARGGAGEPAARQRLREATARLHEVRRELKEKWTGLTSRREAADRAAAEFHRVRAATDRLTHWYRLSDEERARVPEPSAVDLTAPAATRPARPAGYTVGKGTLNAPDGTVYTLRDVPRDGGSFHHALADGLRHLAPGRQGGDARAANQPFAAERLREWLAARLGGTDDPDLLAFAAPDTQDTFSPAELRDAGIGFPDGSPERREFEDTGHLPLHHEPFAPERVRLAALQLRRAPDAGDPGTWDHGAADLLPALAARALGVRVTVVREDGRFQDFAPPAPEGATAEDATGPRERTPHVVLYLADRHFQSAVPDGAPVPAGAARPSPAGPSTAPPPAGREPSAGRSSVAPSPSAGPSSAGAAPSGEPASPPRSASAVPSGTVGPPRPAHTSAPWAGVTSGTEADRYRVTGGRTLTAPDGTVHVLREPAGDRVGNGFWDALAAAFHREPGDATSAAPRNAALDRAREPVAVVRARSLPESAHLDRDVPFTRDELTRAGVVLDRATARRFQDTGDLLPGHVTLTPGQERALVRTQLHTARRWDTGNEHAAVELAAASYRAALTVVAEDGTSRTHTAPDAVPGRTAVLYRRGTEYLLARPRTTPEPTAALPEARPGGDAPEPDTAGGPPPVRGGREVAPHGYRLVRPAASDGAQPHLYEVSRAGQIRTPQGEVLPPHGWVGSGDDYAHLPSGHLLRRATGRIERLWQPAERDRAFVELVARQGDGLVSYELRAADDGLHVIPTDSEAHTSVLLPWRTEDTGHR
ncbi:hypothetical protein SHL15_8385 [Streptomyces hygroscopicus subsp. limoneus]|nr:hypothetical protein SHL15_8385 [Streptomyces hygroscopicus subsp. limoneus]